MSDPFLAEIKMFGGNFAPRGYAFCSGQTLPIAQNTALFSLLGTNYGGNGQTTFGLPNLQNSAPMFWGNGAGLTPRVIGETGGSPNVTVLNTEMPQHVHTVQATNAAGDNASPVTAMFGTGGGRGRPSIYTNVAPTVTMAPNSVSIVGGSQPHNNLQPYLGITFIIATQGIFPQRS